MVGDEFPDKSVKHLNLFVLYVIMSLLPIYTPKFIKAKFPINTVLDIQCSNVKALDSSSMHVSLRVTPLKQPYRVQVTSLGS